MPKISELLANHPAAPLTGLEGFACVQNGITVGATAAQLSTLALLNFTGLTGEVTSVPGHPLQTVIDKHIAPTWFGTHTFNAGAFITNLVASGIVRTNLLEVVTDATIDRNLGVGGFFSVAGGAEIDGSLLIKTNLTVNNTVGVGSDMGVNGNLGVVGDVQVNGSETINLSLWVKSGLLVNGTCEVDDHMTAARITVGTPLSTETGPGDIFTAGGIGVGVGVVGAGGTINITDAYYINGTKVLSANMLNIGGINLIYEQFLGGTLADMGPALRGAISMMDDGQAGLAIGDVAVGGGTTPYLIWSNGSTWTVIGH